MASDNLVMVNGATVMDNVRGTTRPLYVEDAIQETTVLTGAVSAEYGRFTGGVLSTITKSGGNEFSGSLRDSLTNPSWTAVSAAGEPKADSTLNNVYEGTLGGFILRDRLWFFGAARQSNTTAQSRYNYVGSNEQIFSDTKNTRYEIKLTGQVTPKHSLVLNYLNNPLEFTNDTQIAPLDAGGIDSSAEQNEDFKAVHYNGLFTNSLLGEVSWSRRNFTFVGFGGDDPNPETGTPLREYGPSAALRGVANAAWFCGTCDSEKRDSELTTAKLTYFAGTRSLGTHNVVGGVERYTELMTANNWQSPTGLSVWIYGHDPVRGSDGQWRFTWGPGDSVEAFLVETPSVGSDLTTDSAFVNDKWDLNSHFTFNLGLRYDKTKAVDQGGHKTADEDAVSPRLGVTYDPFGNGRLRIGATYSNYVGRLAEGVQGAAAGAGSPNWYGFYACDDTLVEYGIPCFNAPSNEYFTGTSAEVVKHAIQWWKANGGFNQAPSDSNIGGVSTQLAGSLKAPNMNEWTLGLGWQIATNGFIRADYINRDWSDFYGSFTDRSTGRVTLPNGTVADRTLVSNTDLFDRTYRAIQLQASERLFSRLDLGASYTYSKLRGNVEGETSGSGPVSTGGWILQYPEFQGFAQNAPVGYLSGDQTHKARIWAGLDIPLATFGNVNVSVLERYDSGRPYSAVGTITAAANPSAGSMSGVYRTPPTTVSYYFSDRGAYRWDDITRTDLAVNYRLPISRVELFAEAEVFNLFNEQAQVSGSTTIITSRNTTLACHNASGAASRCAAFNPFTTAPVEGVNWAKAANFGKPTGPLTDYQLARTYQFSVGFRF